MNELLSLHVFNIPILLDLSPPEDLTVLESDSESVTLGWTVSLPCVSTNVKTKNKKIRIAKISF